MKNVLKTWILTTVAMFLSAGVAQATNTPPPSPNDPSKVRILYVYTGDTFAIWSYPSMPKAFAALKDKDDLIKVKLRSRVAPNLKSRNPVERSAAYYSKGLAEDQILGRVVDLSNITVDKKNNALLVDLSLDGKEYGLLITKLLGGDLSKMTAPPLFLDNEGVNWLTRYMAGTTEAQRQQDIKSLKP